MAALDDVRGSSGGGSGVGGAVGGVKAPQQGLGQAVGLVGLATWRQSAFLHCFPDHLTVEYRGASNHALDVGCAVCSRSFPATAAIGYFEMKVVCTGEQGCVARVCACVWTRLGCTTAVHARRDEVCWHLWCRCGLCLATPDRQVTIGLVSRDADLNLQPGAQPG